MTLTLQNLRATSTGVEPAALLPGQIAFNTVDKVIYVGDGGNSLSKFGAAPSPGVLGQGWYSMPMDFDSLGDYYVTNPAFFGDIPSDQQILAWDSASSHPVWVDNVSGSTVYVTTNNTVELSPGSTTSAKISAAIGVSSPNQGDVVIVTGQSGDTYQGLYFYTTGWTLGARYAYPTAEQVDYDNTNHPSLPPDVQGAIDGLAVSVDDATAAANAAASTASSALSIAAAALPRAGGQMTGNISFRDSDEGVIFSDTSSLVSISDSISTFSSTTAASSAAVKEAYDVATTAEATAAAALPKSGGTMTGNINFNDGQPVDAGSY